MAILMTGASGFIGKRLALKLLGQGDSIVYLGRRAVAELDRAGAKFISGDITDPTAVARSLEGVNRVYHLAAWFDLGIQDFEKMERINIEGTRNVLTAALGHGVERVVYSSTIGIFHPTKTVVTERSPVSTVHLSHYTRTKTRAHAVALELFGRGCPVVFALPGYVYGPESDGPFGRTVRQFLKGEIPAIVGADQQSSYVHVDDVVEGLVLIDRAGQLGESYLLVGETMNFRDWYRLLAEASGRPVPTLELPFWALYPLATVGEWLSTLRGKPPVVSREALDYLQGDLTGSGARAERELGWHSRALRPGMTETVRWYQQQIG